MTHPFHYTRRAQEQTAYMVFDKTLKAMRTFASVIVSNERIAPQPRWLPAQLKNAERLLYLYFFGSEQQIQEEECYQPKKTMQEVRRRYVGACVLHPEATKETPGRRQQWFKDLYRHQLAYQQQRAAHNAGNGVDQAQTTVHASRPLTSSEQHIMQQAFTYTMTHLRRYGEQLISSRGSQRPRWSSWQARQVELLLHGYFFGPPDEVMKAEARLHPRTITEVRRRFAGAYTLNPKLRGLTFGRTLEWFPRAHSEARDFHDAKKQRHLRSGQ